MCGDNSWSNGRWLYSVTSDKEILTIVNPNITGEITVYVPFSKDDNKNYTVLSKSFGSEPVFDAADKTVKVPANCYVTIGTAGLSDVDEIPVDTLTGFSVYGAEGKAVVAYASGEVTVYSLQGVVAGRIASAGEIELPAGIYVAKCGDTVGK